MEKEGPNNVALEHVHLDDKKMNLNQLSELGSKV